MVTRAVLVPGNGAGDVTRCNWYGWVAARLQEAGLPCTLRNMPDPVTARKQIWLPFLRDELGVGADTVVVGHSSGACAAVRLAEEQQVGGIVLVSGYTSSLGDATEEASGYFSLPWRWEAARQNAGFIMQFGSTDDPFLPWGEQSEMAEGLQAELHKFSDRGHFMDRTFPELVKEILKKVNIKE